MLYKLDEKQILLDYMERYEAEKEVAYNILKAGVLSVEKTAKCCPRLSVEEIKKMQEGILQSSEQDTQTD
ncbi:MAG: hypothetical protein J6C37_02090 [Roseburia sp.]|nr:hypothetical protein [Roseburia sp.]